MIGLPPPKPIPLKDRASFVFVEKGQIDVLDGAFVVVDINGIRTQLPIGGLACVLLEPGTRISHAAVALAARLGVLLIWCGEAAVRLYSVGQPGGARSDRLLWQASLASNETSRLKVVREMYRLRFREVAPDRRSVDQLRGLEGTRVRAIYKALATEYGVEWGGREYTPGNFDASDIRNRCLSQATSCLYGVTEAAILAAGYAPAIGFIHSGKPKSFVYDVADVYKFDGVVRVAFEVVRDQKDGKISGDPMAEVRRRCRDSFRKTGLLGKIIPAIENMLKAGDMPKPVISEIHPMAFEDKVSGDDGHRG